MFRKGTPSDRGAMTHTSESPAAPARLAAGRPAGTIEAGVGRAGALAGLAGVIFYVIGVLLPGSAPRPDAATSVVVAFFVHHRSALLTGFALQLIALVFLLWFLGHLRALVAAVDGPAATTMTAGWVVLVTIVGISTLPAMALIWRGAAATSPDLVRLAYDMQTLGTYAVASTAAIVSVLFPSIVIWHNRILPRWLAVLGAAEVAANVAELAGLPARHGALAGGYADGAGQILWVLWVAAASVCMMLRNPASPKLAP